VDLQALRSSPRYDAGRSVFAPLWVPLRPLSTVGTQPGDNYVSLTVFLESMDNLCYKILALS